MDPRYNESNCLRELVNSFDASVNTSQMNEVACLRWVVSHLASDVDVGSMQELQCLKWIVSHADSSVTVGYMQELDCLRWLVTYMRNGASGRDVSSMQELDCLKEFVEAVVSNGGISPSSFALIVSGAGTAGVNGGYAESGTSDGKTAYQNAGYRIEWVSGDSFWIIKPIGGDGIYSSNGGETNPWDVVSWNGNPPTPAVTQA